jgi:aryl-alcohol dehydrogenase-like predicted oxidoreductase
MIYRNLGPTGIKVSVISYGNWVNSNDKDSQKITTECVKTAWDLGINFFDTAEAYGICHSSQVLEKLRDSSESP